jgi:hypothetical protein
MIHHLNHLPTDHPLRNTPLCELMVFYKHEKASRRRVFSTFAIASFTFNELGRVWKDGYEWTVETEET